MTLGNSHTAPPVIIPLIMGAGEMAKEQTWNWQCDRIYLHDWERKHLL